LKRLAKNRRQVFKRRKKYEELKLKFELTNDSDHRSEAGKEEQKKNGRKDWTVMVDIYGSCQSGANPFADCHCFQMFSVTLIISRSDHT
jgi:hypothetical protein